MKTYWLFEFDSFYPEGGINDLTGRYDTLEEAQIASISSRKMDFFQIVDSITGEVLASGRGVKP